MSQQATVCPACGAQAAGNFCNSCGAPLGPRGCAACSAPLSAQARFCHRCGTPVGGGPTLAARAPAGSASDRTPWIIAGSAIVVLLALLIYKVASPAPTGAAPDMANNGSGGGAAPFAGGVGGPAPDISQMTPRERFDRLYDRIMTAAENHDSSTVVNFSPMALGAYQQLDSIDADARYHAAMVHVAIGDNAPALALADTILRNNPGHLFGYVIRGEVARRTGNQGQLRQSYTDFLKHYDAELKANRPEYKEHQPVIDDFHNTAEAKAP